MNERRRDALEDIEEALSQRRFRDAAEILAAAAENDPLPAPPERRAPTLFPVSDQVDQAALRKGRRAVVREEADRDPVEEAAGRKAQAVIAMLATSARDVIGMKGSPLRAPTPRVNAYGALGRMLKARFMVEPDLPVDEVVAVIIGAVSAYRQPLAVTKARLDDLIRAGRRGPYRTQQICDEITGRGLVEVPLGETRWRPDTSDDDGLPPWMTEPTNDGGGHDGE